MILVSACLVGVNCAFDGRSRSHRKVLELMRTGKLIPICPEQLGGLPTPRDSAEQIKGKQCVVKPLQSVNTRDIAKINADELIKEEATKVIKKELGKFLKGFF